MSILDKIVSKNLFWSVPTSRLPENIREYKCELVIDQVKTENGQPQQQAYLRFIHPITSSTFQVDFSDFNPPASSIYEAEINTDDIEQPTTTLFNQYNSICFASVRNYQRPELKIKEIQFNEDSPFHSQDQICNYFEYDSGNNSQDDYDEEDSLIDFAPENQKEVRHKVLMFLKVPANRFKKMKEIKAHLKRIKFNVPDNHLKAILTHFCGSHIMDKKRGFLINQDYLSIEEKYQRRMEEEELDRKEKQKEIKKTQRKKAIKKETKVEKPGKKKVQITTDDIQQYAKVAINTNKQAKEALGLLTKQTKKTKGGK